MPIGYFGKDIVFETSSERVFTFNDFKHSASSVVEQHKIIGKKPLSEYCGEELDTVNFSINLNAGLGVNPIAIIDKLNELKSQGIADVLVIGNKVIGVDKFIIKEVSTAYEIIYNNGFIFSAKVDLSLEEYISDSKLNTTKSKSSNPNPKISSQKQNEPYYSLPQVNTSKAQNVVNSVGSNYDIEGSDTSMWPFLAEIVEGLY